MPLAQPQSAATSSRRCRGAKAAMFFAASLKSRNAAGCSRRPCLGCAGMQELLLQVDERPRDLDQPLEKEMVVIPALEPEMLEHVVGFVVLLAVEAREIALITRIEREGGIGVQLLDKGRNAVAFFHRAVLENGAGKLFCPASVSDKLRLTIPRGVLSGTRRDDHRHACLHWSRPPDPRLRYPRFSRRSRPRSFPCSPFISSGSRRAGRTSPRHSKN